MHNWIAIPEPIFMKFIPVENICSKIERVTRNF